jgi:peroxiredoxin
VSRSRSSFIAAALTIVGGGARALAAQPEGAELVGTAAPGWTVSEWIGANGRPVAWADLRGKVVLVRWFTSAECPFCHASAPVLNRFHRDYAKRGLVVIGMYHHKRPEPLTLDAVRATVRDYGFEFPVGVDRDWKTLNRWWLGSRKRDFTSVSFLVDRRGVIRHIHPGGTIDLGKPDGAALQKKVEQLLVESP